MCSTSITPLEDHVSFCPRGGCRMLCECISLAPEAAWLKPLVVSEMCSSLQLGPGSVSGACPVSGASTGRHTRETQTLPCVPQARGATVLQPPLGPPALHQPQLCSLVKNKTSGHLLMVLGFQQHKGYPRGISRDP